MWYCICLAVGFISGVVTALLVAARNKTKADMVIDGAAGVEQTLGTAAENVEQAVKGSGTK